MPALRAGRLPAVQAIAMGQAPRAGRGYLPHRLAGRLPVPRPVTAGLAAPFSRPARSAVTLISITAGLTAVVMAAGLDGCIHKINHSAIQGLGQGRCRSPRAACAAARSPRARTRQVRAAVRSRPGTADLKVDAGPDKSVCTLTLSDRQVKVISWNDPLQTVEFETVQGQGV